MSSSTWYEAREHSNHPRQFHWRHEQRTETAVKLTLDTQTGLDIHTDRQRQA